MTVWLTLDAPFNFQRVDRDIHLAAAATRFGDIPDRWHTRGTRFKGRLGVVSLGGTTMLRAPVCFLDLKTPRRHPGSR